MLPCSFDDIPATGAQAHVREPRREKKISSHRKYTAKGKSALSRLLRVQHKREYANADSRKLTPPEEDIDSKVHTDLAAARHHISHAVDVAGNAALSQHLSDLESRVDALQQSAEVEAHSARCHTIPTTMHGHCPRNLALGMAMRNNQSKADTAMVACCM